MYTDKSPVKCERMVWRIVPEETTPIATMLSGQPDFCHLNPLQEIFFGQVETARSLVLPKALDFEPATLDDLAKCDPEKSKRLLDEAGWKMGPDGCRYGNGRRLELLMYSCTVGQNPKLSEALEGAVRKVGIDIKIRTRDPTVFFQKIAQEERDIWMLSVPYTSAGGRCISTSTRRTGQRPTG